MAESAPQTKIIKVPLSEPQMNIYVDCLAHGLQTSYIDAVSVALPADMSDSAILEALEHLRATHPVLTARVVVEQDQPFLCCDAPLCWCGKLDETQAASILMAPFDYGKQLVRFGVVTSQTTHESMLVCALHHMITDFSSDTLLAREMQRVLNAPLPLEQTAQPDLGFVKDAAYCQAVRGTSFESECLQFYTAMLQDCNGSTHLVPTTPSHDESGHEFYVDTHIDLATLAAFARTHGVTTGALLVGAFAYTLSEFSGDVAPVFSALDAGRVRLGLEESLGCFLRTDTLRIDCSLETTHEFLQNTAAVFAGAIEHNACPYQQLAAAYGLDNNICFNYAPARSLGLSRGLAGCNNTTPVWDQVQSTQATNDLDFGLYEYDGHLVVRPKYSLRYTDEYMHSFARAFSTILASMMNVERMQDITVANPADIEKQDAINATEHEPRYPHLLDAFAQTLKCYPGSTLVAHQGDTTTYAQGAAIAQTIAQTLQRNDVKPACAVAVFVPRGQWYLLGALGVLATGAAYVPIDDSHPDERIAFMLADAAVSAVLVTNATLDRAQALVASLDINTSLVNLDNLEISQATQTQSPKFPYIKMANTDTACVLYTSGTTGKPKGSRITWRAIANFCEWFVSTSDLHAQDAYALYVSYGFDVHLEMFAPILVGAATTIVPQDVRLDIDNLLDFFASERIATTELPVAVARLLLGHKLPDTLRVLHTGGEAVGSLAIDGNCTILDTYGPTEFCVNATWIPVKEKTDPTSIGRPLPNTKVYILDAAGRRVPTGAVGELFVSGRQIAAGYINRPEETAAAFTPNAFDGNKPGYEYKYATGDLARYLDDGTIGFLGRRDFQVKIRGNRVECAEVESCLRAHPDVDEVVVRATEIADATELVAYIVLNQTTTRTARDHDTITTELQTHVANAKPAYMVPAYIIILDTIPLTANGKVDARALPIPSTNQKHAPYEAPANEAERAIVCAFQEVLELDTLGATDDFVRLGGDSLKAIRAASLLSSQNISAVDILQFKTPRALAAKQNNAASANYTQADIDTKVDYYTKQQRCPLTAQQLNVYYDQLAGGKSSAYRMIFSIDVPAPCSAADATAALKRTCEAHPILSKRVAEIDGRAFLTDGPAPVVDVIRTDSEFDASIPIDMYRGPLAHFAVLAPTDAVAQTVFCVIHHIIFDAKSLEIFTLDFQRALQGATLAPDLHFLEASALYELNLETGRTETALAFFDDMFADVEQALIPPLPTQSRGCVAKRIRLCPTTIESFAHNHAVTEVSLFAAVFAYTYSVFTGSKTATFCITDSGRSDTAFDESLGMYVNNIPVVIDCSIRDVTTYLTHVYDCFYAAQAATILPIGEISRTHPVAHNIIFQYFADMQNGLIKEDADGNLILPEETWQDSIADLDFYLGKSADDFILYVRHSQHYDDSLVVSFVDTFERIASQVMTCEQLCDMTLCSSDELTRMDAANATEHPLVFSNVSDAVQYFATHTPDALAVLSGDQRYSYKELNEHVDALVNKLHQAHIGTGARVGLSAVPCAQFAIAALAIMRAGASYVPLEMQQPESWINNLIDQAQVCAVITFQAQTEKADAEHSITDYHIRAVSNIAASTPAHTDEACIIFTSGSTGQPKGVQVSSVGIASVCQWCARFMDIEPGVVYGMYQSLSFVSHFEPLYAPLFVGATTDIIPAPIRMDMNQLATYLSAHGATALKMGASIGRRFIAYADAAGVNRLMVSGEQLGQFSTDTNVDVIDAYGASENSARILATHLADKHYTESIGFPVDNTKVYVLDSYGRRLPVGATGMLYTGGLGIMLGYINEPELTASVLIPNTYFADTSHVYDKLWRTGDRARILPDDTIGFLGRADNQVQIHGMRVEPFEVEACIRTLDSIAEATVQPFTLNNSTELVAYVVPTTVYKNTHSDVNELCSAVTNLVASQKPAYMVPAFVVVLDELPRNSHSKLDKRALPSPKDIHSQGTYVAPTTPEEKLLCKILQDVLQVQNLGVEDNLRRLGFNSLQAIETVAQLQDDRLEVRTLLTHDTVRSIAAVMTQNAPATSASAIANDAYVDKSATADNRPQLIPITDEQKKYFYGHGDALFDCTRSYSNVYRVTQLDASVDPTQVQSVCQALVDAHPYLQATFSVTDAGTFIVQHYPEPVNFQLVHQDAFDLSALYEPYNFLDGSPLYRIYLIIDAQGQKTLYFDICHALVDMNSFAILEEDFAALLRGESIQHEDTNAYDYALEVQRLKQEHTHDMHTYYQNLFAHYTREAHDWLEAARARSRKETITRVDEDNPQAFAEAAQRYRQMKQNYNADALYLHTFRYRVIGSIWSRTTAASVEQYCGANDITMSCFLYGIFARAFTQCTNTTQMLLHVVYDGRMMAQYQRTVGCLASTIPLFIDSETLALPCAQYFKKVQTLLNVGYAYSYFSHEDILRENKIGAAAVSLHYYDNLHETDDDPVFDLKTTLNESMDAACMKVFKAEHLFINFNIGHDLSEGLTQDIIEQVAALIEQSMRD